MRRLYYKNCLHPNFNSKILTMKAPAKDTRMEAIERIKIGELTVRTEPLRQALTLPVRFFIEDENEFSGLLNGILSKFQKRQTFIFKDIGGETPRVRELGEILHAPDAQHLKFSDWILLTLDGRNQSELERSAAHVKSFLEILESAGYSKRNPKRGVVVSMIRIDERFNLGDDSILKAVTDKRYPNRFRGERVDMNRYFEGMEKVQKAVRNEIDRVVPGLLKKLKQLFREKRMFYCAVSSLGMATCGFKDNPSEDENPDIVFEGQCVSEPAFVRVMDPLLWMMRAEKQL